MCLMGGGQGPEGVVAPYIDRWVFYVKYKICLQHNFLLIADLE